MPWIGGTANFRDNEGLMREQFMNLYSTHDVFKLAAYCESTGVIPVLYFNLGLLNPFGYRNRSEKNSVCLVLQNKNKN